MAQYDGSIRINTEIEYKNAKKELKSLESSIEKNVEKISSLRSKMDVMKDIKLPTQEYTEIQKQIETTEKKLNDLLTRQEKFLSTGGKETSSSYKRMQYDIEELQNSLPYLKSELQELVESGKAFTLGSDTDQYAQMSAQIQQLNQQMELDTEHQSELQSKLAAEEQRLADIKNNSVVSDKEIVELLEQRKQLVKDIKDMELSGMGLGYKEYDEASIKLSEIDKKVNEYQKSLSKTPEKFNNMQKSARKSFNAINQGTEKSRGLFSTFSSRLREMTLSLLIFNWISKGFNAMISGMQNGFSHFMDYSDSFADSIQGMRNAMSTLGNQFAAAFAPIISMVIPWLTQLINTITRAATYIAQFITLLSGKSTFTKAKKVQDDYNKSLGGTAKAADKARGALAKFDDLDVLEKQDDASGGGAGGADEDWSNMFEEVPVDQNLTVWLEEIIGYIERIKELLSIGFFEGLGDPTERIESIKTSLSSIKDSLIGIWTDPEVAMSLETFVSTVIVSIGTIAGAFASVGLTLATNLFGGIATYLEENGATITGFFVSFLGILSEISVITANAAAAFAKIFEAFSTIEAIQLTANVLGIVLNTLTGIWEISGKLARDILNIITAPVIDNADKFREALQGILKTLESLTKTIKDSVDETVQKFNDMYDEHLKPFFDSIADGLSELVDKFLDFWNENVSPILDKWAEKFEELWKQHVQPVINKMIDLIGQLADFLKLIWENILVPLIAWIIDNVLPVILPIIDGLVQGFMNFYEGVADAVGGIIDILSGIITFLTGVFTGDWKTAWQGITEIFQGVSNVLKGIINGIIGFVESLANGVVNGINTVVRALNNLKVTIPDWVPGIGGNSFGFNIKELSTVKIPRLATGAVIRGGNPFMAILGDQPAGQTNIEAPLDTIRQAVREELSLLGGGSKTIVLTVNGQEFAHLTLDNFLQEAGRQGYDLELLGVR